MIAPLPDKCFGFPIKQLNATLSVVLVTDPTMPVFNSFGCSVSTNVLYLPICLFTDSLNNKLAKGCLKSFSNIPIIAHISYRIRDSL